MGMRFMSSDIIQLSIWAVQSFSILAIPTEVAWETQEHICPAEIGRAHV
jgi:hypothetical protein